MIEFDAINFHFRKVSNRLGRAALVVLLFIVCSFSLTVVTYGLFSLIFRTDTERRLKREIQQYERIYPTLEPKAGLIEDAVAGLQYKDNEIYEQVFHSNAPSAEPIVQQVFASDTIPDTRLSAYTRDKADALLEESRAVEEAFRRVFGCLGGADMVMPPMSLPVGKLTYSQVGASVGRKINPFYKAYVYHEGLDFILPRGSGVYASADGTVLESRVSRSSGNAIVLEHAGGYTTVYLHLEDILVRKGQTVSRGQKIGTVGMSGNAYAPHLHYEIRRNGAALDPMNFLFASVTPEEYANMLYMAVNTQQSMD